MSDVLTVWRWGRQNKIDAGKPLGSYEVWAQWCRDPLLALGCKDPVARIIDIKAADPSRMAVIEVFELWKNHHQRAWMKSTDLHDAVMSAIAIASKTHTGSGEPTYSRQLIARYLKTHAGTCIGGFTLEQDTKTDITRPSHLYRLNYEER